MKKLRCSWQRLKSSDCASLMARLAMIANDTANALVILTLAEKTDSSEAKSNSDPMLRDILKYEELRAGLKIYAFRMLVGHFREGIKIIEEVHKREGERALQSYLRVLSTETTRKYENLKRIYNEPKFKKLVKGLRDEVGFHYGDQREYVKKTIARLADNGEPSVVGIMGNHDICSSRFPIADVIVANVIVTFIWEVEGKKPSDTEEAFNAALMWITEQNHALYAFCDELCGIYFASFSPLIS